MFAKTPRLILKNSVNIKLIIKVEKDFMISQILDLEVVASSPQRSKASGKNINIKGSLCKKLSRYGKIQGAPFICRAAPQAFPLKQSKTTSTLCKILHRIEERQITTLLFP